MKSLNIRDSDVEMNLNYALFQRLFCRSIFKESLIEVLHEIEKGVYRKQKIDSPRNSSMKRRSPMSRVKLNTESQMVMVLENSSQNSQEGRMSPPMSPRRASMRRVDTIMAEAKAEKESKQLEKERAKKEKNLSLDIKNYQRKTMLNGIDQLENLDENYDLVKQAEAMGINTPTVTNFKGKEILDCLNALKIEYDSMYFSRQTYKEFLVDPLGAKLIDAWAATDPTVKMNTNEKDRIFREIKKVAA